MLDDPTPFSDPRQDPDYVEAFDWQDLELVGSDKWIEEQEDPKDNFTG